MDAIDKFGEIETLVGLDHSTVVNNTGVLALDDLGIISHEVYDNECANASDLEEILRLVFETDIDALLRYNEFTFKKGFSVQIGPSSRAKSSNQLTRKTFY